MCLIFCKSGEKFISNQKAVQANKIIISQAHNPLHEKKKNSLHQV